nr:MAG TPA: hypothetical protein [Herelleviridae sp.]
MTFQKFVNKERKFDFLSFLLYNYIIMKRKEL